MSSAAKVTVKAPILDFSTIVDRESVRITSKKNPNGKVYELAGVWDLGPVEQATLLHKQRSAASLQQLKRLSGAQKTQLTKLLGDIVMMIVMGLEPAVLAEMDDARRSTLILGWVAANQPEPSGNRTSRRTQSRSRSTGSS